MRFYRTDFLCLPAEISTVDTSRVLNFSVDSIYNPTGTYYVPGVVELDCMDGKGIAR